MHVIISAVLNKGVDCMINIINIILRFFISLFPLKTENEEDLFRIVTANHNSIKISIREHFIPNILPDDDIFYGNTDINLFSSGYFIKIETKTKRGRTAFYEEKCVARGKYMTTRKLFEIYNR